MTEDRFDRCCWWYIALLVITVLVIVMVMWAVAELEDKPPTQDPPTETVNVPTQEKAAESTAAAQVEPQTSQEETPAEEPIYQATDDRSRDEWQLYLHFTDDPETYLGWRFLPSRQSYEHLIDSGRSVYYTGDTQYPASDGYKRAALIAYSAYKVQTWCRLSGFPGSPYADEETALHFCQVLLDNGCAIEPALAIIGFESTYGLAAGSNDFGILWGPGKGGQVEDYVAYIHNFGIDGTDASDIARNYNPSGVYHDNVVRQAAAIKAEAY